MPGNEPRPPVAQGPANPASRQTAVEMLIRAAEDSPAWLMIARIAMRQVMSYGQERVFPDRKETHWEKRKLKRDQ